MKDTDDLASPLKDLLALAKRKLISSTPVALESAGSNMDTVVERIADLKSAQTSLFWDSAPRNKTSADAAMDLVTVFARVYGAVVELRWKPQVNCCWAT